MASPTFQREIDDQVQRVPYLNQPEEILGVLEFFVAAGEAAYPQLLEMAVSEDPRVAGTAFAALGSTRDQRLVPHILEIPEPPESSAMLRYEWARCLLKLGDWSQLAVLIDGLENEELIARAQCYKALNRATRQSFDYHPQAGLDERQRAVAEWRAWLAAREG